MSEEEPKIIENQELTEQEKIFYADLFVKNCNETFNKIENDGCLSISVYKSDIQAIQGLLDLYNKEKEKNKELKDKIKARIEELQAMYNNLPINPKEHLHSKTEYLIVIGELESLLEEGE